MILYTFRCFCFFTDMHETNNWKITQNKKFVVMDWIGNNYFRYKSRFAIAIHGLEPYISLSYVKQVHSASNMRHN